VDERNWCKEKFRDEALIFVGQNKKIFQSVFFNTDKAKTCGLLGQITIKYGCNLGHKDNNTIYVYLRSICIILQNYTVS
jgi:hypothetical protein